MLIPRPRQAECLVPRRQLHRASASIFRERDGKHLKQDAINVVFRLLLRQAKRVHLHAVTKAAELFVSDAIAFARDFFPEFGERTHLAEFGDVAQTRVHEERDTPDHFLEIFSLHFAGCFHAVENCNRGRQCVSQFLHRRRACFLQMIGADVHRIPLRHFARGVENRVLDQPHGRRGRENICAAREVFLDDVVLCRAGKRSLRRTGFFRERHIKREQPSRGRVDGHRRIHRGERNTVE